MNFPSTYELTSVEFDALRQLVLQHTGISLSEAKLELVKRRFTPRLRELKLNSFSSYIKYIKNNHADELTHFSNAITTNLTSFFREKHHFEYMKKAVIPHLLTKNYTSRKIRIWSAGCSTGQEPYTLAMVLRENIPDFHRWDVQILATDLDKKCLEIAREGVYRGADLEKAPSTVRSQWFLKCRGSSSDKVKVKQELKEMVSFLHLNLIHDWPMRGPFDIIFCRNVFIYFNKERQKEFVSRFADLQQPGNHLFIGHSETIGDLTDCYRLTGQTVYGRQ